MFSVIQTVYRELPAAERAVADYLSVHPRKGLFMTVRELAAEVSVSEGTVVRLAQRCGFKGFSEFKIQLAVEFENERSVYQSIDSNSELQSVVHQVFGLHVRSLENTLKTMNFEVLDSVVSVIHHASRVELYGVGSAGMVAMDAAHKLMRMGISSWGVSDSHIQLAMATLLTSSDVAIGISHSGMTRDTIDALRAAKESGAATIAITSDLKSPISKVADFVLKTTVNEPILRSGSVASRLAQLAVVDAITLGIHLRRREHTERLFEMTSSVVLDRKTGGEEHDTTR